MSIHTRIEQLGIVLPEPAQAVANYVPWVRAGELIHISGQLSNDASGGIKGTVGVAARLCGINLLAQIKAAVDGDFDRVRRIVKLGGFVQAGPEFSAIPAVINGCSDLMVEVFGDAGRHARSAVGVYRLPLGFAVEVDAIVEVK